MDLTFEACGHLADLLARYSRIEAHYRIRHVKDGKPIEDAMVRVYTAILVYAAEVQRSIESGKTSQCSPRMPAEQRRTPGTDG
jgi:hypothetical protein